MSWCGGGEISVVPGFACLRRATNAQVLDRHAEASGSDLLDGAVLLRAEALGVFAALAGVGHRAESVEGECDRLVRLRGKRAKRHRPANEMLHDRVYRLDGEVFLT